MTWLTTDEEFTRFLNRVSLSVKWRERPVLPDREQRAVEYQRETDLLADALRSGSRVKLELAVSGMRAA